MVDISPICVKIGRVSVVELSVAIINLTSPQVQLKESLMRGHWNALCESSMT